MKLLAVPKDAKSIRSQPVARRLDNGEGCGCSNRSINRIAALLQDLQPCLSRQSETWQPRCRQIPLTCGRDRQFHAA